MYFRITNKNPDLSCPALKRISLPIIILNDKNGAVEMSIDLTTIDDLITLDSVLRMGNTWYEGIQLNGNKITILEGSKYESE